MAESPQNPRWQMPPYLIIVTVLFRHHICVLNRNRNIVTERGGYSINSKEIATLFPLELCCYHVRKLRYTLAYSKSNARVLIAVATQQKGLNCYFDNDDVCGFTKGLNWQYRGSGTTVYFERILHNLSFN